ncbi:hypothetical protein ACSBR1_023332 [Camellia fascicularis]
MIRGSICSSPSFLIILMAFKTALIGSTARSIEKPLQRHGGRLEHNETYCGSCYGAEVVCFSMALCVIAKLNI